MFDQFKSDVLSKLEIRIAEQGQKSKQLESTLALRQIVVDKLVAKCDDNEQYSRRSCVRINGVEIKGKGKDEDVMELISQCYEAIDLPFNPDEVDRAHRIGIT